MAGSVHTIILNWRTAEMTIRSLDCAVAAMDGIPGMITVVDNDSGDGSFERISAHVAQAGLARARVVQSGRNGGFGAGNNVAMFDPLPDGGAPDYVYLLNSDAFPEPDAIGVLRDYLDAHPAVGIAGSRIVGEDGVLHDTAFRFPSVASEFEGPARTGPVTKLLRRHLVSRPAPANAEQVDWVAGASMMMRRTMLDRIGGSQDVTEVSAVGGALQVEGQNIGHHRAQIDQVRLMLETEERTERQRAEQMHYESARELFENTRPFGGLQ